MTLNEMEEYLSSIANMKKLGQYYPRWINDAISALALSYDFPPLALITPYLMTLDTTKWLWSMPDDYHKKLFRVEWPDMRAHKVTICRNINEISGRDHTVIGDRIRYVAVAPQGSDFVLGVFPMAVEDLNLWYYRKPAVLSKSSDTCDCIPPEFHEQVIIPAVMIRNYKIILDQVENTNLQPITYWKSELAIGLKGNPAGESIGLLNFYNINYHPPRRIGGPQSIGWRPYRYYGRL